MSNTNQAEDTTIYNQNSLEDLAWGIENGQGQFFLKLAHCNYAELREQMVQQIKTICTINISKLRLKPSDNNLYTKIREEFQDKQPAALMILGLDIVNDIDQLLRATNQVREEFRRHCPFPLVLWINDKILIKLKQLAPDFKNWGTIVFFQIEPDVLIQVLREKTNILFSRILNSEPHEFLANETIFGNTYSLELKAALKDLSNCKQTLEPDLKASLEFLLGRSDYGKGNIKVALEHYHNSLALLRQIIENNSNNELLLKQATLLFNIGLCHTHQSNLDWQKSKQYFKYCLDIFERLDRLDLVAKFINYLGDVFVNTGDWDDLDRLAQKSLNLHRIYLKPVQLAQDYGFLAMVALHQNRYRDAYVNATLARNTIIEQSLLKEQENQGLYYLLLAQAEEQLGHHKESVNSQQEAVNYAPQNQQNLYLRFLKELRLLYFKHHHYLDAYKAKQDEQSFKQQIGLTAFVGASRLKEVKSEQVFIRQEDVKQLIARLATPRNKLTIIYGQSGVGKSSLIEAALIPQLKQKSIIKGRNILTIVLRVYTRWIKEIGRQLTDELQNLADKTTSINEKILVKAVLEQFEINDQQNKITVIIFDQFEEFFFVCKDTQKRKEFFDFFAQCLEIPYVKVILSLREDYLHLVLLATRKLKLDKINNNILGKDILYYIGNFSPEQAIDIIDGLTARSMFSLEPSLINQLVEHLTNDFGEVRPIELQVVGSQLQEKDITTLAKYQKLGNFPKEILIKGYLDSVIKDCGKENEDIAFLVLYLLTGDNDTRPLKTAENLRKDLELLEENLGKNTDQLKLVLDIFVEASLVLILQSKKNEQYQLVHDYLVKIIRQEKGASLTKELKKLKESNKQNQEKIKIQNRSLKKQRLILSLLAFVAFMTALFAVLFQQQAKYHETKSLITSSDAFYKSNTDLLDALLEALRAKKTFEAIYFKKDETNNQVLQSLQNAVLQIDGFREKNRLNHDRPVVSVSFNDPNNDQTIAMATADFDNTVKLWNSKGKELNKIKLVFDDGDKYTYKVNKLSFQPNDEIIFIAKSNLTTSDQMTVQKFKRWTLTKNGLKSLMAIRSHDLVIGFSNGQMIATTNHQNLSSNDNCKVGNAHPTPYIWCLEGKEINIPVQHKDQINNISLSPDGKMIASASDDTTVKLWYLDGTPPKTLTGHKEKVNNVSFSSDGKLIASASDDQTIKVWSLDGKELKTLKEHTDRVKNVSFSPDSKVIASVTDDQTVTLWSLDGKLIQTLTGHEDRVSSVSFSSDSNMIATVSDDKTFKLWSWNQQDESFELLKTISGHTLGILDIIFSSDNRTIATASFDGTVKLWRKNERQELRQFIAHQKPIRKVSISLDSSIIATASDDKTVKLWNQQGEELRTLTGHKDEVLSVSLSSILPPPLTKEDYGGIIATASADKTVKLWNLEGKEIKKLDSKFQPKESIWDVSFSHNGQLIAATIDNQVQLWNREGKPIGVLSGHNALVRSISFSPIPPTPLTKGDYEEIIATASRDNTVKLWHLKGQKWQAFRTLKGHTDWLTSVSFSPDGKTIASTSLDRTIKLWNLNGELLHSLSGHQGRVTSVSFNHEGDTIATGSADQTIKLWHVKDGKEIQTLTGHKDEVNSISYSSDGTFLISADNKGKVIRWKVKELPKVNDLGDLATQGCQWIKDYLENGNTDLREDDKYLCDN